MSIVVIEPTFYRMLALALFIFIMADKFFLIRKIYEERNRGRLEVWLDHNAAFTWHQDK